MSAIKQYEFLLKEGDLLELYPGLKGNWEEDRVTFTKLYTLNMDAIKELDTDFYEEYNGEE